VAESKLEERGGGTKLLKKVSIQWTENDDFGVSGNPHKLLYEKEGGGGRQELACRNRGLGLVACKDKFGRGN